MLLYPLQQHTGERSFVVIDVDTGVRHVNKIQRMMLERTEIKFAIAKVFCTSTVAIILTPNVIQFFNLKDWERLEMSFQRYLTTDFLTHSRFSPKRTVLAIPRLTGDMVFLDLCIPMHSSVSNGQENCERVGGVKRSVSPGPGIFGNIPKVRKNSKES